MGLLLRVWITVLTYKGFVEWKCSMHSFTWECMWTRKDPLQPILLLRFRAIYKCLEMLALILKF